MSTSVTTTTSLITPDISTLGKSSRCNGGSGGTDADDISTADASSCGAAAAATSLLLAASTEQLNQVIRKINPFEANFREANKVKKEHDLYSDQLSIPAFE
uniref:Uncharacterized protein n=1 Tax=Romanomermis culicivorax TaxID=13658 RepID=A0A915JTK7_ROMCU